jgi:hypothetical protein
MSTATLTIRCITAAPSLARDMSGAWRFGVLARKQSRGRETALAKCTV